jgi:hypothetical protein
MNHLRAIAFATVALVSTGCGLISSDVTDFDLTLKDKKFTIDTASWGVTDEEAQQFLSTSCASSPTVCSSAAQAACPMDCSGECNATTQTCDLGLEVSLHQGIDLKMEQAELSSLNDEPLIKVTIDSVNWQVTINTLNVDTPEMLVYVAPMSVMDPSDPLARPIGTIDAVTAGTTTESRTMTFTDTGKADLAAIMGTYTTPFNVIVGSKLVVRQGQPVPSGKLEAVVQIKAHAGL